MSFLYRNAITITRKQAYIDWANAFKDGGPELSSELAATLRTIYLVPEANDQPDLAELLNEFWEPIFEQELAAWILEEQEWPAPRTREMFDEWFGIEATDAVMDLVPEEPLTQSDVDLADLAFAMHYCAWCESELAEGAGRFVGFSFADREREMGDELRVLALAIDDEQTVIGVVPPAGAAYGPAGDDLVFRACTARCEKALRKAVPKALRRIQGR
jgi:hypothetical protein